MRNTQLLGTKIRMPAITRTVQRIAVDCAFKIPNPFPALNNCKDTVMKMPLPAAQKAAAVGFFLKTNRKATAP